jgi:hypothetical protein
MYSHRKVCTVAIIDPRLTHGHKQIEAATAGLEGETWLLLTHT